MADNHIPVFYEGQDDLIDILATSICSICHNTKSFIDFYILDCGIHSFNKKQLESLKEKFNNFSIKYIPIDLKQFEGLKGYRKENFLDCYSRLLIPELEPSVDRAIYLDTDVIALDDIKKLWDEKLDEYEIGAVPDIGLSKSCFKNCIENLDVSPTNIYPNAGVLLINCKKWRENKVSQKLFEIAKKYKEHIVVVNEDILSIYYNNTNYKILNNRYNLSDRTNKVKEINAPQISDEYLNNEWKNVVIQHLAPGKSWKILKNNYNNRDLKHFNNFWFFARMTPFYEGMHNRFLYISGKSNSYCVFYKLFGFIPILKIKK